jgi:hypothetical protein
MQAFNSDLEQHLLSLEETRGRLQQAQRELVDLLYSEIHGADSEKRHALLAVKRDCFNGRPLAGYRDKPVWATVVELSGSLSEEILRLETRVAILENSFESAFASEKDRQSNAVARLFEEPDFLCGLATSSSLVGGAGASAGCLQPCCDMGAEQHSNYRLSPPLLPPAFWRRKRAPHPCSWWAVTGCGAPWFACVVIFWIDAWTCLCSVMPGDANFRSSSTHRLRRCMTG